jgi:hypothetical protein
MNQPLTRRKRKIYLIILAVLFILLVPIIILYSFGYRLDNLTNLIKTGGIYISAGDTGVSIILNGEPVKTTNILQRSYFIQNLRVKDYTLTVHKQDSWDWEKTVSVYPEKVTEVYPFMITKMPAISIITKNVSASATSTKTVLNPDYSAAVALFKKSPTIVPGKLAYKIKNKIEIWKEEKSIILNWTGNTTSYPYFFCTVDNCKQTLSMPFSNKINYFDFFPGRNDLLIVSLKSGVFVSEITESMKRNMEPIFYGENADFRIQNGEIILKNRNNYYSVSL